MLDMAKTREVFEASEDFTVGIEEEFAILDPETLSLAQRFEELRDTASGDEALAESISGELIRSEIEIRSGRGGDFGGAGAGAGPAAAGGAPAPPRPPRRRGARPRLFSHAADQGAVLAATGTHPW